ncbi:MAG: Adenine specific methylase Mod [Firmicutes bacterium]|nr:Adenine specific methylase Mod [Bacillota bacterium]
MAAIHDLINQIENPELRARIQQKIDQMNKQKKFGLVFEEHLPECTPLYDIPVRKDSTVALKAGKVNETYVVLKLKDDTAVCLPKGGGELSEIPVADLVSVAEFGETIYPYLKPIDSVCNAPDSDLWHTLIEADNYHALQLLEYLYAGKVDCIYIDPPYNTGARDWKYNNDYVDGADTYRHSKWLSMIQKRLKIAKKLLNSNDSVMIVTIDEKEYLHLGCLLEEMFPEARIQMVSVAIHSAGVSRSEFSRTDEYYYFVFLGKAAPKAISLDEEWSADGTKRQSDVRWESMLRSGNNGRRKDRPNLFFPVHFDKYSEDFVGFGTPIPFGVAGKNYIPPEGCVAVLPYASDGSEACWRISAQKAMELKERGAFDWGAYKGDKTTLKYLKPGELNKIENGEYTVTGYKENGAMIISSKDYKPKWIPGTQWHVSTHQAGGVGGSVLIKTILGEKRFDFPKSVYAVRDSLRFIMADTPNALIVDFFAGSGTTLHAVNLLNAEDGGHRRCIMVTNNEVSVDEAKSLSKQGYQPGDQEWEKLGIARYVTWPRTVCSIEGHDVNVNPLKGNYLGSDIPMADGFKANAVYFKLSFLNKTDVALGRQFKEMLPTLWMKAGAYGPCPKLAGEETPTMLVLPENRLAILTEEATFPDFEAAVNAHPEIETIYIVTDYEAGYCAMAKNLSAPNTYQLYRDYLDNFRINTGRN